MRFRALLFRIDSLKKQVYTFYGLVSIQQNETYANTKMNRLWKSMVHIFNLHITLTHPYLKKIMFYNYIVSSASKFLVL